MSNINRKKKKILYYESGSSFGGSAVSLYRLVKYLDKESFRPYVFVHGVGPRIKLIMNMGVHVRQLSFYHPIAPVDNKSERLIMSIVQNLSFYVNLCVNTMLNASIFYKTIKSNNINLIHLNNGIFENFPALMAAKLCGIPCVSHVRGTEPLTKVDRTFGRWASKIITLNSEMHALYTHVFGADKACIVFNGVDLDAFENVDTCKLRHEYQVEDDSYVVGTIARLVPGKGIPEFIKAAAEVIKVNRKLIFFIIGDDPNLDRSFEYKMKLLCSNLGINDHMVFTGWRDDVIDLMSGLDLVVQVSTYPEGMSLTPIEAMALGKPVITSNVSGYTDTVEHGVTGFIVPAGDITKLANEIQRLAADKHLSEQLGPNGRQKALREFDAKITAKRIETIYHDILVKDKN